jgi:FixJ family two-component response regulator
MDLVIAFTGMNRYQRGRDSEGYYLATEDDFNAAKALFTDKDGEELVKRLTKKERETLEFLVAHPDGVTQDDLAEHLKVSRQRAGHILYGRDKERGGLMQKVQLKEERRSEMT